MPYRTVPAWDRFTALTHAFFGRVANPTNADRRMTVAAACTTLGLSPATTLDLPIQVHGDRVAVAEDGPAGEADGVIVLTPGRIAAVVTADCCPLLLIVPGARAAAAVHAGWRGTAAAIAAKAVARLCAVTGVVPAELHAALGPTIGPCCYEVGDEVVAALERLGEPGRASIQHRPGQRDHADLRRVNRALLIAAGMNPAQIHLVGGCTACATDFPCHSFRRDRAAAGRQLSVVGWR
ncbi:MAG: multicopper polyphenol oxidase [Nitrospirae bacterium CG18_big_fil_WC_8_21_14_2_50_70_55]|nr:laccase domain-containing protein [Deltaproteobacteria bacterium]OIP67903.1 MAG: hypothetical protein AUK30_00100 [Nitrospirae bacterium CG2_30_70_394]PIQ04988.1 MAG: multicopper polyphenol oxidase [Nitrospirae bacterium CG18_big_fil_WC_8_21_14_2_50_70_55]PIU77922.1 MAG: laccase domain-containing protein [Nitrospirae bacterium CG06_land_8_20_14_3_00_70_43]PIW83955.1 MAG: laccase domain-containing protein [Nitrospirae bacterium CG_4_8_14_3_um_filter_70_85]PIX83031.1 MAG: laccase domain-conta